MITALFNVFLFIFLTTGCAESKLINTSPNTELPIVEYYEPIDAVVHIKPLEGKSKSQDDENGDMSPDPKALVQNDVAAILHKMGVFTEVVPSWQATGNPDLELLVTFEAESDSHFAKEMGEAVLSGLTLGLAQFAQDDEYDYSVRISGKLTNKKGNEIGRYEGAGSYYSVSPKSSITRHQKVVRAVELSWEHALKELAIRMKMDKDKILAGLKENAL